MMMMVMVIMMLMLIIVAAADVGVGVDVVVVIGRGGGCAVASMCLARLVLDRQSDVLLRRRARRCQVVHLRNESSRQFI